MKPVDQTVFTVPGGNCFSACVASLLELPLAEVPYFMGERDWLGALNEWLAKKGFFALFFDADVVQAWVPHRTLCILGGKSPRGSFDHAVVGTVGFDVVHDPHPSRAGLDGDVKDATILVPMDPLRAVR